MFGQWRVNDELCLQEKIKYGARLGPMTFCVYMKRELNILPTSGNIQESIALENVKTPHKILTFMYDFTYDIVLSLLWLIRSVNSKCIIKQSIH